ncbi:LOW QUALITY PROTEIN: uncharacterized protein LOC110033389 [Phalaenopsis equestris]|uniref:LOW QUALITY PROTEIN: uncharacterized protein LOC110033389 n=1 Tax=Phalaenopsis equestris TaxID=78828 RepID=UPI0009E4F3B9|nr:LOW QUALITY PROTEIN: uncharacterized protein LOC110033389 [Phalaenopsis equestris]
MESRLIFPPFPSKLHHSNPPTPSPNTRHLPILCSSASPNNNSQHISTNNGKSKETKPPPNLNIRYRARSRRQMAKQEKKQKQGEEEEEEGLQKEPKPSKKKKWEEMKLSEKALEVYMGEKGLLFWVNKFAYASIFVVIGGWILFRFLGPSLGLYQLDSPPLSPSSLLKGG